MAIDLAYLNGVDTAPSIRYLNPSFNYEEEKQLLCGFAGLNGIDTMLRTHDQKDVLESIVNGNALMNYSGMNTPEDMESLRAYIVKTKKAIDDNPALIQSIRNPQVFSNMLSYLLQYWDTAERVQAAEQMMLREKQLADRNYIKEVESDDPMQGLFFAAIYHAVKPQSAIAGLAGSVLKRMHKEIRNGVKANRKARSKAKANGTVAQTPSEAVTSVITNAKAVGKKGNWKSRINSSRKGIKAKVLQKALQKAQAEGNAEKVAKINAQIAKIQQPDATPVQGFYGLDMTDEMDELTLAGLTYGLEETEQLGEVINDTEEADRRYLTRLNGAIAEAPALFFDSPVDAGLALEGLGAILENWDTQREAGADYAEQITEGTSLNGFFKKLGKKIKKAVKKVGQAIKKVAKKVGKAIKKVVKKIGKAIAKVAKKVWKFIVKFNPITAIIRAMMLLMARCNWFGVATKCYAGSLSKEDAMAKIKGMTDAIWEKSNKGYKKMANVYTKIGGTESKLKARLEKGYKRKAKGDLNTTINLSKIKELKKDAEKEADEEQNEDNAELKKKGQLVEDEKMTDSGVVVGKTQIEVVTNAVTTIGAANLYETASESGKVLATIPKGVGLLYDQSTNNTTFYNVNYNGQNGFVKKTLTRTATDDEASKLTKTDTTKTIEVEEAVSGVGGLGWVFSASGVAASVGTISGVVASLLKVFGKDKAAAIANAVGAGTNAVADTANQAQDVWNKVKTGATDVVTAAKDIANNASNVKTAISSGQNLVQTVQNAVNTGKEAIDNVKQTVVTAKTSVTDAINSGKDLVSNVKTSINDVKAIANGQAPSTAVVSNNDNANNNKTQNQDNGVAVSNKKNLIIAAVAGLVGVGGIIYLATRRK